MDKRKSFESQYEIFGQLGEGNNGRVLEAKRRRDSKIVALKYVSKHEKSLDWYTNGIPEVVYMQKVSHIPGCIQLLDYFLDESGYIIVMERPQSVTNLCDFVVRENGVSEDVARWMFSQVLATSIRVHQAGVSHNDIKLDNILLNERDCTLTLIDFGNATEFEEMASLEQHWGTFPPPELFTHGCCETLSDIAYTLGTLLYSMLCARVPFQTDEDVVAGKLDFGEKPHFSSEVQHLLSLLLSITPRERPTFNEIYEHDWMNLDNSTMPLKLGATDHEKLFPEFQKHVDTKRKNGTARIQFESQFILGKFLREELNGTVYSAVRICDSKLVALKYVYTDPYTDDNVPLEVVYLQKVAHIHGCIRLLDCLADQDGFIIVTERPRSVTRLSDYIRENGVSENVARWIFSQLLLTLIDVYEAGVSHNNIRLENILLNRRTWRIQLTEFGYARDSKEVESLVEHWGTFTPPEFIKYGDYQALSGIARSLGGFLYNMLCRCARVSILACEELDYPENLELSHDAKNLTSRLVLNPPSFKEIFSHAWMNPDHSNMPLLSLHNYKTLFPRYRGYVEKRDIFRSLITEEAPSVTGRCSVITSKVSQSQPLGVLLVEAVSSVSLV